MTMIWHVTPSLVLWIMEKYTHVRSIDVASIMQALIDIGGPS
jgi:hypothetical protein